MSFTQNYKFGKFGLKTRIFTKFYEIWHSQQIEHANHEYNTRQCLERSRDYWLKMITGCKNSLAVRRLFIALTPL